MFLHHRSFSESVHVFLPVPWDSLFKLRRGYHGPLICLAEGLYSLQGPYLLKKKAQGRCNEKRSALRRSRIWNPENDSLSCSIATYCGISHTLNFSFDSLFTSAVTTGQVSVRTTSAISFVLISLIEPSKVSFFPAVWRCNLSAFIWTAFEL